LSLEFRVWSTYFSRALRKQKLPLEGGTPNSYQAVREYSTSNATNLSLSDISVARRVLLEKYLRGEASQPPTSPLRIAPRPSGSALQLSFAQERLWFLDQLNPDSAVYNVPLAAPLSGPIDADVLKRSVNEIVRRHEALRTTFATVDGQPVPVTAPALNVDLRIHDLSSYPDSERHARADALLSKEAQKSFDLTHGPLIRTSLVRLGEREHVLLVVMHHIVSDGWSLVLFFQELSAIYGAFSCGDESPLAGLSIQYGDYASWQREWLRGEVLQKQLSYWKEQLGGELPVLELPTDRPRPAVQTFRGAREWLVLPEELTSSLMALSQREGATLFITLLAGLKALLNRYSGQEDIIVGSPIANRPQTETESLIGFFLNNLALRSDLAGNPGFRELLARVKKTALDAYAHQDVPFEKLIEELKPERDLSRTPIFQVYFNLFNFADGIKLPGTNRTLSFVEAWAQSDEDLSKFDLTLYAGQQGRELRLALVYNTDLFDAASITRMLAHFKILLEGVVADPETSIADLPLRIESDAHLLESGRVRPSNAFIEFRKHEIEQSIANRFARQVEKYPRRIAVKSTNHEWTYDELNRAADRIAQSILRLRGDGEERIALLFEHDAPMIAAMLGALKAGKTYVPLDPHHPHERLAQIVGHSKANVLVTNNRNLPLAAKLTKDDLQLVNIDRLDAAAYTSVALPAVGPDQLAYILYTSGSTGQPKGVMQNHRNVLHHIRVYTNNLHLNADDRMTLLSSYCFDASVMDIYGALLNGAALCPVDVREDGLAALAPWLIDEEITVYHSTPTVYRYFVNTLNGNSDFRKMRLVVLGGEEVKRTDVESYRKHFSDDCILVNGLGPTEATVSLQNFIDKRTRVSGDSVPVGFPVADTEVLLLNSAGRRSEIRGEIAIKSAHVALGYWQNIEATAAAFSTNGSGPTVRIYRTGDMGRRLPDGRIKFEGRKDFQVKIRGFRIELGEIESALVQHPNVRECVVVASEDTSGNKRLVAYVVPRDQHPSIKGELRDYLKQRLPEYMTPSAFVLLQSLPLTASGKLNRRALPAPDGLGDSPVAASALPQTQVEKLLAAIWADLLGVSTVGVNDNFFELGGHSLLAVRLFAQIEKRFGKRLPLATLFRAPTIAQIGAILEKDWTPAWSSLVPVQPAGSRPPFFCVHALGGNVLEYYDLARHLGTDQPFYGLQSQGLDGKRPPHTRVEEMAAHYIKEMREAQPTGPYYIGGRSLGGMVAFEMAHQLRTQGQEVGLLALLDTYPSGYAKLLRDETTWQAALGRAVNRIKAHSSNLWTLSAPEKLGYLMNKLGFAPRKIKSQVWRRIYQAYENVGRPLPQALRDVKEFNSLAVRQYVPQVYDGAVTLFWASADLRACIDFVEGWRALAGGGIEVHEIPGSHLDIVKEPHVRDLATKLDSCLRQTQVVEQRPLNTSAVRSCSPHSHHGSSRVVSRWQADFLNHFNGSA
jgi:amino acid adenylation domain-containing protein